MRKIKWSINISSYSSVSKSGEFEVEDDATDKEIEEMAQESAFEQIDWTWWEE